MSKQALLESVSQAISGYNRVLLAFSGGLDSTVLLYLLQTLRQQQRPELAIRAVYIHHGLSENADRWSEHCQRVCLDWQISLTVMKVQLAEGEGIEAAARKARYGAFSSLLAADEVLLTAQHQDDQCETLMLALKRGSGPAGLSSMAGQMPFLSAQTGQNTEQIRPLLAISRQQIEAYARQQHLHWINDESNQDDRFDRNFFRLRVLPLLSERWPHFSAAVARSASLCAEQEQLLDELLTPVLDHCVDDHGAIAIDDLLEMSVVKRQAVLRRWFAYRGYLMPAREQLQRIWQEIALARADAEPKLQIDNWQVRRFKYRLYLLPLMVDLQSVVLPWDHCSPLTLPDNLGQLSVNQQHDGIVCSVRAPLVDERVTIRFTAPLGLLRIVGRNRSRSIKKLWSEFGVAPWRRGRVPLLFYGEKLVAAVGVFVTEEGEVRDAATAWQLHWHKK